MDHFDVGSGQSSESAVNRHFGTDCHVDLVSVLEYIPLLVYDLRAKLTDKRV
jgi:hypothetical protein